MTKIPRALRGQPQFTSINHSSPSWARSLSSRCPGFPCSWSGDKEEEVLPPLPSQYTPKNRRLPLSLQELGVRHPDRHRSMFPRPVPLGSPQPNLYTGQSLEERGIQRSEGPREARRQGSCPGFQLYPWSPRTLSARHCPLQYAPLH